MRSCIILQSKQSTSSSYAYKIPQVSHNRAERGMGFGIKVCSFWRLCFGFCCCGVVVDFLSVAKDNQHIKIG